RHGAQDSGANRLLLDPQSVPYQPTAWHLPLERWKQTLQNLIVVDMQTNPQRSRQDVQPGPVHGPFPCRYGKYRALLHRQQYDGGGPKNSVAYRELSDHREPMTGPLGCRRVPLVLP